VETTALENLLRRDRVIIIGGLIIISALAWCYVMTGAGTGMNVRAMTRIAISPGAFASDTAMPQQWTGAYWAIMVAMWWVMMIAMMVPSAAPMILLYARVTRHEQKSGRLAKGVVPTAAFVCGYLIAWLVFSVLASVLQFYLEGASLVHSMLMWSLNSWLSAGLLFAAGLYQITPYKQTCLRHCRSPAHFLSSHWRPGHLGALRMGIEHGAFCVGCCWALMALLFVGGIMNLLWIAGLAVVVLVEKVVPRGAWVARAAGLACIAAALSIAGGALGIA
jgi:predicted metal-binding membrane protein